MEVIGKLIPCYHFFGLCTEVILLKPQNPLARQKGCIGEREGRMKGKGQGVKQKVEGRRRGIGRGNRRGREERSGRGGDAEGRREIGDNEVRGGRTGGGKWNGKEQRMGKVGLRG